MSDTHTTTRGSLILRLRSVEDIAAWDEFTALYGPVIDRVAARRGFQPADAENLNQEVFLAVAKSISDWIDREDRGRFRAWLIRIARNEAADLMTRRATRPLGRDGSGAQHILAGLTARDQISSELDKEHERTLFQWAAEQVREAVAAETWDAFWLTSIEGLSVSEVTSRLNIRPGNIYIARCRVMARLKTLVAQYGDIE